MAAYISIFGFVFCGDDGVIVPCGLLLAGETNGGAVLLEAKGSELRCGFVTTADAIVPRHLYQ